MYKSAVCYCIGAILSFCIKIDCMLLVTIETLYKIIHINILPSDGMFSCYGVLASMDPQG